MNCIATVVIVLLGWATSCHAYSRPVYPFPLDSELQCEIPNPLYGQFPDAPSTILEAIPSIPIQPGLSGFVWLPQESG